MLRTAQNLPHMEQESSCSGVRSARMDLAVSGSRAQAHWPFPVQGPAGVSHFIIDLPGATDTLGDVGGMGGDFAGHDALFHIIQIGESQMLGRGDVA